MVRNHIPGLARMIPIRLAILDTSYSIIVVARRSRKKKLIKTNNFKRHCLYKANLVFGLKGLQTLNWWHKNWLSLHGCHHSHRSGNWLLRRLRLRRLWLSLNSILLLNTSKWFLRLESNLFLKGFFKIRTLLNPNWGRLSSSQTWWTHW